MELMVIKSNDEYWVRFESYDTVQELIQSMENRHHDLILGTNEFYGENPEYILEFWEKINLATAEKISKTKYTIEIYNSYIE
jgi:hypothetical protein